LKVNSGVDASQKPEEQATARTDMLSFWKMKSSSGAVVEKKKQPITSDLRDGVDTPFNNQLDADSSTPHGDNDKKIQVATEERMFQGAVVDNDADASDALL
jgi:hypothetical protein